MSVRVLMTRSRYHRISVGRVAYVHVLSLGSAALRSIPATECAWSTCMWQVSPRTTSRAKGGATRSRLARSPISVEVVSMSRHSAACHPPVGLVRLDSVVHTPNTAVQTILHYRGVTFCNLSRSVHCRQRRLLWHPCHVGGVGWPQQVELVSQAA